MTAMSGGTKGFLPSTSPFYEEDEQKVGSIKGEFMFSI